MYRFPWYLTLVSTNHAYGGNVERNLVHFVSFVFYLSFQLSVAPISLSFAGLSPTFSLSLSLYSKSVDMTINLSLTL